MRRLYWFICIILGSLFFANSLLSFFTLNILQSDSGENLLALPVSPGDRWEIHYIHSLYRVPQKEIYHLNPRGEMVLEEMSFGSYPAALYYSEDPPQGFIQEDSCWKIKNINQPISQFRFKVGFTTNCYLMMKGEKFYFTSLAPPGESPIFTVEKASFSKYLFSLPSLEIKGR